MEQKAKVKFVKTDGKTINYSQKKFRKKLEIADLVSKDISQHGKIIVKVSKNVESVTFENCRFERSFKFICNNLDTKVNFVNCTFCNGEHWMKCEFKNGNVNFSQIDLIGCHNFLVINAENLTELNVMKYNNSKYCLNLSLEKIKKINMSEITGKSNIHFKKIEKVNMSEITGKSNIYIEDTKEINLRNIDVESNESLYIGTSILNMDNIRILNNFCNTSLNFDTINIKDTLIMTTLANIMLPNANYKKLLTDEMINSDLEKAKISLLSVLKGYRNKIKTINAKQEEKINSEIDSVYNPKIKQLQEQIELEKERASLARTYTKKALNKRKVGNIKN